MVAGGRNQQRKLLKNSPAPNKSTYFPNDFAIELQDESVVDEVHVHWRDYRLALPREHLKLIADAFTQAKKELESFEATHEYKRKPHLDRTMEDFATEHAKYAGHEARIMGEADIPISEIHTRFDNGDETWVPDEGAIQQLVDWYTSGRRVAPIVLSTEADQTHQIIDGNHRLFAAKRAGLTSVNSIITDMTFEESKLFRKAETLLKQFDEVTGFRFNTSGFNRQFFAHRVGRYYSDHFHKLRFAKPYKGEKKNKGKEKEKKDKETRLKKRITGAIKARIQKIADFAR